jgi:acetyltransferase-like isoleucine patch superfamily enzyme
MFKNLIRKIYQKTRIKLYSLLSENEFIGIPIINQPAIFNGKGKIKFEENVQVGYNPSPSFYDLSIYFEARDINSSIVIGKNTFINNGAKITCDRTSIIIGESNLIGLNFEIMDSDFHGILPENRNNGKYECIPVRLGNNVFIGNNVRILKGVTIGDNSIVANSSLVTKSIPPNSIAAGNPARVIKNIYEQ